MASSERLELPTVRLEGACSIQLSYEDSTRIITKLELEFKGTDEMNGKQEKKGYHFVGWYIDKECTKRINPGGILPTTMTLYDKWTPIWYPVHYELNGGTNSRKNPRYINVESGVLKLYPARKTNMAFDYWTLDGKQVEVLPEGQCDPITLVAHYRPLCLVNFETFGGGNMAPVTIGSDGYVKPIKNPMKIGYTFNGWYRDPQCIYSFSENEKILEPCTLYAGWTLTIYTISYEVNGGICSRKNPHFYTYEDDDIVLLPAKKKGYRFLGWFDDYENRIEKIPMHSIGNRTLRAKFEEETE